MISKQNALIGMWSTFAVISIFTLASLWLVETPAFESWTFLPTASADFHQRLLPYEHEDDDYLYGVLYGRVSHFLNNADHVSELESTAHVDSVVLEEPEPVPFPATQMVDHIVVDGITIRRVEWVDPAKGPLLARVLQDAAQIEWRLLWRRALTGTAAWAAALAAMLGLTWLLRKMNAHSKKETGQG